MTDKPEPINVVFLRTVGFQRFAAVPVEIKFNPEGITFIEGKNGSGKSSALDALLFAWGGKSALAKQPIHEGLDEATAEIGLSNGRRIVRHIKRKGDKQFTTGLELFGPEGEKFAASEATVKEWLGDPGISFDPMEFSRMDPKKRRVLLAQIVGIDLDKFDADETAAEQTRLAHFGVYETAKRKHESMPPVLAAKPAAVDVAGLNQQLSEMLATRQTIDTTSREAERARDAAELAVALSKNEIINLKDEADALAKKLAAANEELKALEKNLPVLVKTHETAIAAHARSRDNYPGDDLLQGIQAKLATASEVNRAAVEYDMLVGQRNEINTTWKAEEAKREELSAKVEAVRDARLKALQTATFPIEGLGFEAEDCTYNSIPFSQSSQSEKIKVGMAIAMAQRPKCKVISSYDGSLLDGSNLVVVDQMARGQGYTVVLEVVADKASGRANSIYLEDGMVAKNDA